MSFGPMTAKTAREILARVPQPMGDQPSKVNKALPQVHAYRILISGCKDKPDNYEMNALWSKNLVREFGNTIEKDLYG